MTRLDIFALGAFRISVDQRPIVSLTSKKAQTLLVYLASYRQRRHPRATLAGLFWPEIDEPRARASLRVELHKIRRALGEAGLADALHADDHGVQLLPEAPIWLDSLSFCEDVDQGLRALGASAAPAMDRLSVCRSARPCATTCASAAARPAQRPSGCSRRCTCPTPSAASSTTRTSFRAASASASASRAPWRAARS